VFAALTSLAAGEYYTLAQHHVLPPNLLELSARNAASTRCLLPLKQLRELSLFEVVWRVAPAEELQQLSSLTALTSVDLSYWADADEIDEAAGGWGALKITSLFLQPACEGSFARETLQHLSTLTALESLEINNCGLGRLEPELLAAALGQMSRLSNLDLGGVYWDSPEDEAADARSLAALLRGLASRRHQMQSLEELKLHAVPVSRAAATALSKMHGLRVLRLTDCGLDDSSISEVALGLKPWLQTLNIDGNPGLTDACLPALKHAVPGLTVEFFRGCPRVTQKGLQHYVLCVDSES
jgi:hypothetical protein